MKGSSIVVKLITALVILTVLVYVGLSAAAYLMDPYSTSAAYTFTSENAVIVSGYVVRQEEPLAGSGQLIYFSRGEGEKVSTGGTVAMIYSSGQALDAANTVRRLEQQLQQQTYARSLSSTGQNSVRLEQDVTDTLVAFRSALTEGSASAASSAGAALQTAVLRRSYAYAGAEDLDSSIAALQAEISALSAAAEASITRIRAPRAGLFSSMVDGYESVLTPESLETMTARDYRTLQSASVEGAIGKLIYGTKWFFATLMRAEDMGRLQVGDSVRLRFQTGLEQNLTMTVERVGKEDQGQCLVVLSSDKYLSLTTPLRRQNAQIIFDSYTGIRVPRSAVRIVTEEKTGEDGSPILRADGTAETVSTTGVYCLWGASARFKQVDVIWQEEAYLLVTPAQGVSEQRRLRPGDQVITAAENLYDGKVIQ